MSDQSAADTTKATEDVPDFGVFLLSLAKGRTYRELGAALRDLTAAVTDTGKPGRLTLTIEIKQQSNTDAVTVTDRVAVKAPAYDRPASIFFVDATHNLVRDNPGQNNLFQEPR